MNEPVWRQVLNWGCVLYFLLIPAIVIVYITFDLPTVTVERVAFVTKFHIAVTAIIATMLGLNSWDKKNGVKNGVKHE